MLDRSRLIAGNLYELIDGGMFRYRLLDIGTTKLSVRVISNRGIEQNLIVFDIESFQLQCKELDQ